MALILERRLEAPLGETSRRDEHHGCKTEENNCVQLFKHIILLPLPHFFDIFLLCSLFYHLVSKFSFYWWKIQAADTRNLVSNKKMLQLGHCPQGWTLLFTKEKTKLASPRLRPVPAPGESRVYQAMSGFLSWNLLPREPDESWIRGKCVGRLEVNCSHLLKPQKTLLTWSLLISGQIGQKNVLFLSTYDGCLSAVYRYQVALGPNIHFPPRAKIPERFPQCNYSFPSSPS